MLCAVGNSLGQIPLEIEPDVNPHLRGCLLNRQSPYDRASRTIGQAAQRRSDAFFSAPPSKAFLRSCR